MGLPQNPASLPLCGWHVTARWSDFLFPYFTHNVDSWLNSKEQKMICCPVLLLEKENCKQVYIGNLRVAVNWSRWHSYGNKVNVCVRPMPLIHDSHSFTDANTEFDCWSSFLKTNEEISVEMLVNRIVPVKQTTALRFEPPVFAFAFPYQPELNGTINGGWSPCGRPIGRQSRPCAATVIPCFYLRCAAFTQQSLFTLCDKQLTGNYRKWRMFSIVSFVTVSSSGYGVTPHESVHMLTDWS